MTIGDARLPKKFWDRVTPIEDGCWIWTGAYSRKFYGNLRVEGRTASSHEQ